MPYNGIGVDDPIFSPKRDQGDASTGMVNPFMRVTNNEIHHETLLWEDNWVFCNLLETLVIWQVFPQHAASHSGLEQDQADTTFFPLNKKGVIKRTDGGKNTPASQRLILEDDTKPKRV